MSDNQLESRLDELLAEFLRRADSDPAYDREAFLREYGNEAEALSDILKVADLVDRMAGPILDESASDSEATVAVEKGGPDETASHDVGFEGMPSASSTSSPDILLVASGDKDQATIEFGDYELLEVIGRGGMGVVYKARQISLDRFVAVKMILGGRFAADGDIERFYTEAKAAAKLEHLGVVRIYNVGEYEGHHYFVMDLIEGTDLSTLVDGSPLDPQQGAQYLKAIAEAVHFAHEKGILHRDLKPANVLINEHNHPLITDFGLAKYLGEHEGLTNSGAALGTPSYMSPEQASGRHEDVHCTADVYSLGAILYAMMTGVPPFRAGSTVDTLLKVINQEAVPPSDLNENAGGDLETICMKCLHKEAAGRYQSAAELAEELGRYIRGEPIKAKPLGGIARALRFVQGIPVVAAITGSRLVEPSFAQRRVQQTLLVAIFLVPILSFALFAAWRMSLNVLPKNIRIATGSEQGMYFRFGQKLTGSLRENTTHESTPVVTSGSGENRRLLIDRKVSLALLQASAVRSDRIAVVAPVYYEVIHVLARRGKGIRTIRDLAEKTIWIGPRDSGMWLSAKTVLEHFDIQLSDVRTVESSIEKLMADDGPDAAILTVGLGLDAVSALFTHDGPYELLPIEDAQGLALQHPAFHSFLIKREFYPDVLTANEDGELEEPVGADIQSIATIAFLAARSDAPDVLITTALDAMYSLRPFESSNWRELGYISRELGSEWQGLAYHPAARRYFENIATNN